MSSMGGRTSTPSENGPIHRSNSNSIEKKQNKNGESDSVKDGRSSSPFGTGDDKKNKKEQEEDEVSNSAEKETNDKTSDDDVDNDNTKEEAKDIDAGQSPPKKRARTKNKEEDVDDPVTKAEKSSYAMGTVIFKPFDGEPFQGVIIGYDGVDNYYKVRYEDGDEEEMDEEEVKQHLVGTIISKEFDGKPFRGKVVGYDSKDNFFKVKYDDSDEEEMDHEELVQCMSAVKCHVGTVISKEFDGKPFRGKVIEYDAKEKLYKVQYEDGDEEEMDHEEVMQCMVIHEVDSKKDLRPAKPPRVFGLVGGPEELMCKPDYDLFARHPCRVVGGERHNPEDYGDDSQINHPMGKSSFAYLVQRISDRNYAMRGLCVDGDGAKYSTFSKPGMETKCVAFLPETNFNHHFNNNKILDACHLDLIHPETGACLLTPKNLKNAAATPKIECIFLNGYERKDRIFQEANPKAIVDAITACKNTLKCFALTECVVSKEILAALAACKKLRGLVLSQTQKYHPSPATDQDLASVIENCRDLRWLYVDERSGLFDNACWTALAHVPYNCPNIEVLWVNSTQGTDKRKFVARGDHNTIRRALRQRSESIQLCMINPDPKIRSRFIIDGDNKSDRLNGDIRQHVLAGETFLCL